ncbi:WD40 repeat-like protein [Suillus weaverae]|nr:WD40 repeat-like protein [Suillus weaverae]
MSGYQDGMFRVWNVKSGKTILGPIKIGEMVYGVRYSPDGKMISTGGNMLRIWDANTGEMLKTFEFGIVGDMAWTSDGNTLITGSRRLDIATWTEINGKWLAGSSMDTVLSPNERILASIPTADNHTAQLWNLENHQPIGPPLHHEDEDKTAPSKSQILISNLSSFQMKAVNEPFIDANAARLRAPKIEGVRRVPHGFFDDVPRRVNSSTSRGHHTEAPRQSTQPSRLPTHNPLGLARNFISGLLRRRDGSAIRLPPVVEVPLTAGKPRNYHARKKPSTSSSRPPKPPTTQQQNTATQSNLLSSQQPNATATSSTTPPPVTGTAAAAGTSHPDITIKRAGWRARFLLWVCCVPTQRADGQHWGSDILSSMLHCYSVV